MSVPPPFDPYSLYVAFVGRFINQFAQLERLIRIILWEMSGMTQPEYDVMVGFPRTSEAVGKLRRMVAISPLDAEAKTAIADAFVQLLSIIKIRDRIVHYGGGPNTEGIVYVHAKPTEPSKVTGDAHDVFTQSELENAAQDVFHIQTMFYAYLFKGLDPDFREGILSTSRQPRAWRYISPEQRQNPG